MQRPLTASRRCGRCSPRPPESSATRLVDASGGAVPTIVDLTRAAGWDEREAHDLYGVGFYGHEPLRPLVDHDGATARFTTPVLGSDPYQLAVGPIHAGVIESGHFRFHVVGDLVLHVDARLFYKHRGLERAAEGLALADALAGRGPRLRGLLGNERRRLRARLRGGDGPRADAPRSRAPARFCSSSSASGTPSTTSARSAPASGSLPATSRFAALVDDARRAERRTHGPPVPLRLGLGRRLALWLDETTVAAARPTLARIRDESSRAWKELLFNGSFMDRMPDIGVVDAAAVQTLGASAWPRARPASPRTCARRARGSPTTTSRPLCSAVVQETCRHASSSGRSSYSPASNALDRLLATAIGPSAALADDDERLVGIGRVESPRGATVASSSATATASDGSGCAPGRTPTGRASLSRRHRTFCPTSLSSTRASSSATRASTADADAAPRPTEAAPASRAPRRRPQRVARGASCRLRLVQRLRARVDTRLGTDVDLARYGIGIVASPRHADVLLVTGPVTTRMRSALLTAYEAMPEPRRVVALGDCAVGCGVLGSDSEIVGAVEDVLPVDFRIQAARRHRRRSRMHSHGCSTRRSTVTRSPVSVRSCSW